MFHTNEGLNSSSYPVRTEFNNFFIIFWNYFKLSLNACFISKKTQAANNGTAWNCSETLISQSDYEKNILKTIVRLQGQSIYDEMSHNVIYLFSTPNLSDYKVDMAISPLALNQSKLLKYFQ